MTIGFLPCSFAGRLRFQYLSAGWFLRFRLLSELDHLTVGPPEVSNQDARSELYRFTEEFHVPFTKLVDMRMEIVDLKADM